jgi:mRNA-degrading endonuclease toxin of MazEF toxin-antitoxin module
MKASYAVVPGIRQVTKARLQAPIGQVSATVMTRLEQALALYLGE